MEYEYKLAKRGKSICPKCGHKTFVLYVDAYGKPLSEGVGKCDRENNCGYHCPPREYFKERDTFQRPFRPYVERPRVTIQPKVQPSYMDAGILKQSMSNLDANNLVKFLVGLFGEEKVCDVVSRYYVGTWNHFGGGAVVFWQVDQCGHIRAGKVMGYDPTNGKRIKQPYQQINWMHSVLKLDKYELSQCLFGEHLLRVTPADEPILIVESEKTALLMSCILDGGLCLATGGCQNINLELFEPLRGRDVVLFPDSGTFEKWSDLCNQLKKVCKRVCISDVMEIESVPTNTDIGDLIVDAIHNPKIMNDMSNGLYGWYYYLFKP